MNRSKSPKPTNMKLYNLIKAEAKKKFKVYPSVYASSYIVKQYKKHGGKYSQKKPSKSRKRASTGLTRWYAEKWIDICTNKTCGRPTTNISNWKKTYPLCRPSRRINKSTPKTVSELNKAEIKIKCSRKKRNPLKKQYF